MNSLAVLKLESASEWTHLVASAASDGMIVIWGCNIQEGQGHFPSFSFSLSLSLFFLLSHNLPRTTVPTAVKLQVITLKTNFPLALDLAYLPNSGVPVLASASVDCKVTLWTLKGPLTPEGKFEKAVSLEGHDDWIRCLAFAKFSDEELCLASCSQDRYIRLWKITAKAMQPGEKAAPSISEILESISV